MKLLFDENLSPKLTGLLQKEFPDSVHVRDAGLRGAGDRDLWDHASRHGLVICSKDNDFRQLAFVRGHPPKVIWLDVGNLGTTAIAAILSREVVRLRRFEHEDASLIVLSGEPGPKARGED